MKDAVCVCACVRVCVRACVCVHVCVCVRAHTDVHKRARVHGVCIDPWFLSVLKSLGFGVINFVKFQV